MRVADKVSVGGIPQFLQLPPCRCCLGLGQQAATLDLTTSHAPILRQLFSSISTSSSLPCMLFAQLTSTRPRTAVTPSTRPKLKSSQPGAPTLVPGPCIVPSLFVRPPAKPRIALFPPLRLRLGLRLIVHPRSPNPKLSRPALATGYQVSQGKPHRYHSPGIDVALGD